MKAVKKQQDTLLGNSLLAIAVAITPVIEIGGIKQSMNTDMFALKVGCHNEANSFLDDEVIDSIYLRLLHELSGLLNVSRQNTSLTFFRSAISHQVTAAQCLVEKWQSLYFPKQSAPSGASSSIEVDGVSYCFEDSPCPLPQEFMSLRKS